VVINSLFSVVILLIGVLVIQGSIPWTLILLPVVYLPLVLFCLGLSWFLASLGVFVRDIRYLLEVGVRMLLFLTPIFYPASAVPAPLRFILYLNPLTLMVDHFRQVILFGQIPNWVEFGLLTSMTLLVCLLGYIWFMKSKKIFADII
jgi:lipopolysaccharide transport system permease protein